jgi:hypothetical protein
MRLRPSDAKHPRGEGALAVLIQELADKYKMPFEDVVKAATKVLDGHSERLKARGVIHAG